MDAEVEQFLDMGIIAESCHEAGEVISSVFLVRKVDGSNKMI